MKTLILTVAFLYTAFTSAQIEGNVLRHSQDTLFESSDGPLPFNNGPYDKVYDSVDIQAKFRGGDSAFIVFVTSNFEYPPRCLEEEINGFVLLRFVVDLEGNISRITPVETTAACPEFTQEAIRLIKLSPKWIPAQIHGKFVSSWRQVPIRMNLE